MKIKYLPSQPHCFGFGGFDIQMISTSEAISKFGQVDISKLDVWSRENNFDILHCWGLSFSHYENYLWAKKTNKKLIATILMQDNDSLYAKFKFKVSSLLYKQRLLTEMLHLPDKIIVVNEDQAKLCNLNFKIPTSKIHIIPHVLGDIFFKEPDTSHVNSNNQYVLTVGNVCSRKNQIALAKACIDEKLKLVIIGKVLDGEYLYGDELTELVNKNSNLITWIHELKENSKELVEYYKNCSIFALPSYVEQQPISLLEAAAFKKPLLIADRNYAKQKFYNNSCLVDPSLITSIRLGLQRTLKNPLMFIPPYETLKECQQSEVGKAYTKIYNLL